MVTWPLSFCVAKHLHDGHCALIVHWRLAKRACSLFCVYGLETRIGCETSVNENVAFNCRLGKHTQLKWRSPNWLSMTISHEVIQFSKESHIAPRSRLQNTWNSSKSLAFRSSGLVQAFSSNLGDSFPKPPYSSPIHRQQRSCLRRLSPDNSPYRSK